MPGLHGRWLGLIGESPSRPKINYFLGNVNRSHQTAQIISGPNELQIQNLHLANSLYFLQSSLDSIISENRDYLSEETKIILTNAKDQLGPYSKIYLCAHDGKIWNDPLKIVLKLADPLWYRSGFWMRGKDELTGSILLPLFSSVSDSIEAIILTMHKEDFSMAEYHGKKSSPYIREMEGFIKRVVRDHFR